MKLDEKTLKDLPPLEWRTNNAHELTGALRERLPVWVRPIVRVLREGYGVTFYTSYTKASRGHQHWAAGRECIDIDVPDPYATANNIHNAILLMLKGKHSGG